MSYGIGRVGFSRCFSHNRREWKRIIRRQLAAVSWISRFDFPEGASSPLAPPTSGPWIVPETGEPPKKGIRTIWMDSALAKFTGAASIFAFFPCCLPALCQLAVCCYSWRLQTNREKSDRIKQNSGSNDHEPSLYSHCLRIAKTRIR